MTDRELWADLEASIDRDSARLEPRFGTCPVCLRNASAAISIGPITWALCRLCQVRWFAGYDLLERIDDDSILPELMESLAQFEQLPGIHLAIGGSMKEKTPFTLDPWAGSLPARNSDDSPHAPPLHWHDLLPQQRAVLGGVILEVMATHPVITPRDVARLAHVAWMHARFRDRKLELRLQSPPFASCTSLAEAAIKKLAGGRDLLTSLKTRRNELDAAIAKLESMEPVAS